MADHTRRMLRWKVPVDDRPHTFELTHSPVHVAVDEITGRVEFWAEDHDAPGFTRVTRTFQVYGTGHHLPPDAIWVGTCDRTVSGLVWHLYERMVGAASG